MGDVKYPVGELCTSSNTPFWSLSGTSLKFFFRSPSSLFTITMSQRNQPNPDKVKRKYWALFYLLLLLLFTFSILPIANYGGWILCWKFLNLEGRRCWDDVRSFFPRPGFVLPCFILASKGWTPDYRNSLASNQRTCIHTWVNFSTLNNHTFTNMALSRIWQKEV